VVERQVGFFLELGEMLLDKKILKNSESECLARAGLRLPNDFFTGCPD